ncbi:MULTISPECIES: restriction endonuclease subunit S [Empedobacter]|uniref:restriction endonuclease subunit S n=1 Tax=Empedobacter TaxID=59734 RepID=UPI0025BE6D0F|nr:MULTISPECIES: restriction endonuclease subunit S [unclassified Empedobacter]
MEQHKNVPAIRFKGFQEEWTEKNITELSKVFIGLVTTMTKFYTNSGTLLIRNSDIKNNYFEFAENPIYLEQKFADQNSSRKLLIGDVVTVHTGDVGTSAVISENEFGAIGFATINTRVNKKIILPNYLSTFLNSSKHKKFAIQNSTGDGRSNYNLKDFFKLNIPLTSIEEQTQIGNFFKNIDEQINLHEQKHQKLVNLKKAMLEKMFPKEGANVPEIRFKGFTEKWEEKMLGEKINIGSGSRVHKNEWINKGVPFFRSSDVVSAFNNRENSKVYISLKLYNELILKSGKLNKGDLLVTGGGTIGIPYIINSEDPIYSKDADLLWFKVDDKISSNYLFYFFCSEVFKNYIKKISHIGTISHYTIEQAKNTPIKITSLEEQQKIGAYFEQLDNLIQQSQVKIEKYKNIKQALLQKMFV